MIASPHIPHRKRAGFSVMELLVVMVVLAVLVTFSLGVFSRSVMNVRQIASVTTLKGIGQALAAHVADHGELPGPSHTRNMPPFAISNKLITHLWPYLGRKKQPKEGEVIPEYVPAHWVAWYQANHQPKEAILYWLANPLYSDGQAYILWGYPGNRPPQIRARWSVLAAAFPLSTTVAVRDALPSDANAYPEFGVLQDYTTFLYLDWHVEVRKGP